MFDFKKSNVYDIFKCYLVLFYVIFGFLVFNGRVLVLVIGRIRLLY